MVLLAFAGLCLAIALALAWLLGVTLFFPEGAISKHIADRQNLVRAHIDYLMMSQFLLIFSLLFRQYAIDPPLWLLGAICYGAFFNPLGFLLRAFTRKPSGDAQPDGGHLQHRAGVDRDLLSGGKCSGGARSLRRQIRNAFLQVDSGSDPRFAELDLQRVVSRGAS